MSGPDTGQNQHHCADRREILRRIGASSAIVTLGSILPTNVLAQNKASGLPPSIEEAGKKLRNRSLSVTELTQSYLKGAKDLAPKLNPFITVTEEEALKTAAILETELTQGKVRGPLHGIPIVYKDNIDTAGTLTTVGSQFLSARVPQTDAHVVTLLKRAGVVMIAKTNMNEFAAGVAGRNKHFGDARNPWDLNRWPGGSSSGTGVSIAAGMCLGGLGTVGDVAPFINAYLLEGGSLRRPHCELTDQQCRSYMLAEMFHARSRGRKRGHRAVLHGVLQCVATPATPGPCSLRWAGIHGAFTFPMTAWPPSFT
jgi:Amidase